MDVKGGAPWPTAFVPIACIRRILLPQSPREWLPEGHLAFFLEEMVSLLDLRPIFERYEGGRGPKAYHPQMLLTVLLYGYCTGVCKLPEDSQELRNGPRSLSDDF